MSIPLVRLLYTFENEYYQLLDQPVEATRSFSRVDVWSFFRQSSTAFFGDKGGYNVNVAITSPGDWRLGPHFCYLPTPNQSHTHALSYLLEHPPLIFFSREYLSWGMRHST